MKLMITISFEIHIRGNGPINFFIAGYYQIVQEIHFSNSNKDNKSLAFLSKRI